MAQAMTIGMVMLGVADAARSADFYEQKIGFVVQNKVPGFVFLSAGAVTLVLSEGLVRSAASTAGAVELVIPVEHVKPAVSELESRGVEFIQPPRIVTGDRWAANFRDPDGHLWSVFGAE